MPYNGAIVYSVIDKKSLGGSYYGMAITSAAASIYSLHYVATGELIAT